MVSGSMLENAAKESPKQSRAPSECLHYPVGIAKKAYNTIYAYPQGLQCPEDQRVSKNLLPQFPVNFLYKLVISLEAA